MAEYIIRPVPICKTFFDRGLMTYRMNYGQKVEVCTYLWYIEGSEPRIAVDTGAGADMYHAHGFADARDVYGIEEGLGRFKLKSDDIDIIILTHLHWDHMGFAHKFARAKFIIQKAELDFARQPHPIAASAYDKRLFSDLNFEVVDGDREIIDGVRVLLTPGHSPGAQSVAIGTAQGLAVITGFCCISDNFEMTPEMEERGLQIVAPGLHVNAFQAYDSALKVKQIADIIVPQHDAGFIDRDKIP